MIRKWLQRARAVGLRERIHQEIADEREFHVAMRAAELEHGGMPPQDADAEARRRFGRAVDMQETGFDIRGGGALDDLAADWRIALRVLKRSPARSATLLATIALGVGLNAAVFRVIQALVLDPLHFPQAGRLVTIRQLGRKEAAGVSYPNFADWRRECTHMEEMALYARTRAALSTGDRAERVHGAVVSASFFHVLGVQPLLGRTFTPEEDARGNRSVVISEALWRVWGQGRVDVLGRSFVLDGERYQVVGVIPQRQVYPLGGEPPSYWITVAADAEPSPWGGSVLTSRSYPRYDAIVGRLRAGATLAQAEGELTSLATEMARLHPKVNLQGVRVRQAVRDESGNAAALLWTLYGAVFCVLAVACANTATVQVMSAASRSREFGLRVALGAGSGRIARQLLVENLVLAAAGGIGAAGVAWVLLTGLARLAPPGTPALEEGGMARVVLYTLGLASATGVFFGLAPARLAWRTDPNIVIKPAGGSHRPGGARLGATLIALQIAISLTLACGAAVLTGSFWRILHTARGFDPRNVLTATITLPDRSYPAGSAVQAQFYEELADELRRVPGITHVGVTQSLPLSGQNNSTTIEIAGASPRQQTADLRFADAGYFTSLGMPLRAGRWFDAGDGPQRQPVVLVNEAFAARLMSGQEPLGARLKLGWGGDAAKIVVGVVGNIRHQALDTESRPEVYVPITQFPLNGLSLVMRVNDSRAAGEAARALRSAVSRRNPDALVEQVRTLEEWLVNSAAEQRFLMWVLGLLAGSALFLTAIGLYGTLSYSAVQRRREFGVRMALGASREQLVRLVLGEGLRIATLGILAGLAMTLLASARWRSWLFQTDALDARGLAAAGALLLLTAAAATFGPAWRATKVDPASVLRSE